MKKLLIIITIRIMYLNIVNLFEKFERMLRSSLDNFVILIL